MNSKRIGKKPDPGMMANGMLAGLVAITAPCAFVQPWAAAVIGIIAGVIVVESVWFFERRGIDDPVGAISVHGVCGIFGVLSIGIFSSGDYGAGWNLTTKGSAASAPGVTGILYNFDLGLRQLGSQVIGSLVICIVMFGIAYAFFKFQDEVMKGGIRPTEEVEMAGMDLAEMGALAYDNLVGQRVGHRGQRRRRASAFGWPVTGSDDREVAQGRCLSDAARHGWETTAPGRGVHSREGSSCGPRPAGTRGSMARPAGGRR